jgi:hypothetical protein
MGEKIPMNFWETPEWVKLKTGTLKTERLLSRVEYVRRFGAKSYSEDKYQAYLKVMSKTQKEDFLEILYSNKL